MQLWPGVARYGFGELYLRANRFRTRINDPSSGSFS
jgi:hypothetical protein